MNVVKLYSGIRLVKISLETLQLIFSAIAMRPITRNLIVLLSLYSFSIKQVAVVCLTGKVSLLKGVSYDNASLLFEDVIISYYANWDMPHS